MQIHGRTNVLPRAEFTLVESGCVMFFEPITLFFFAAKCCIQSSVMPISTRGEKLCFGESLMVVDEEFKSFT